MRSNSQAGTANSKANTIRRALARVTRLRVTGLRATALIATALVLTACGGSDGSSNPGPAAGPGDDWAGSDRPTMLNRLATTEVAARALVRTAAGEDQAVPMSGDLFAAIDTAERQLAIQTLQQNTPAGVGVLPAGRVHGLAADPAALSTGSYVSSIATGGVGIGMLLALTDRNVGMPPGTIHTTQQSDIDANLGGGTLAQEVTIAVANEGSRLIGSVIVGGTYTAPDGRQSKNLITANIDADRCPDANGVVKVQYSLFWSMGSMGAGNGAQLSASGTALGAVGDNAELLNWTSDSTLRLARQAAGTATTPAVSSYIQVHNQVSAMWDVRQSSDVALIAHEASGDTSSVFDPTHAQSVARAVDEMQFKLPALLERFALGTAREHWRNGACVEVVLEGAAARNTVAPSSTTPFTAKVRHKFEGVELNAPIAATLSGGASIDPTQSTPAPVHYRYLAPDTEGRQATVQLETRSRRGVGNKSAMFETQGAKKYAGSIVVDVSRGFLAPPFAQHSYTAFVNVIFVREQAGINGVSFKPDPATVSVKVTDYVYTDANQTCEQVGDATGPVIVDPAPGVGGLLTVMQGPPAPGYPFPVTPPAWAASLVTVAAGTERCVNKFDGKVTTRSFLVDVAPSTMPGTSAPGDPGFRTLTDPAHLTTRNTTSLSQEGYVTGSMDTTWDLVRQ